MKKFLQALPVVFAGALIALSGIANAQSVQVNGIGSSALFLEAGLAASATSVPVGTPIAAACVWTTNSGTTTPVSNVVSATDTSTGTSFIDSGSAWVAWTPSSLPASASTCAQGAVSSSTQIYAYLQTDSVVGDRCLFNANGASNQCTIHFPVAAAGTTIPASGLIYPVNDSTRTEFGLPPAIASALNTAKVNAAGTDIRPEDAWFAVTRGLTPCGTAVASGSQYLGLGYGDSPSTRDIQSFFGGSAFHAISFTLPTNPIGYTVTPVGATPILVVINGQSTSAGFGAGGFSDISSANLAGFLDGHLSMTGQVNGVDSGSPVTVLIREPLSGTYNTMEYNVPNRTTPAATFQTSQDVGLNQQAAQRNCNGTLPLSNPMNIATTGGGARKRAIGTGQELTEVRDAANHDVLGYGFWSVANFNGFTSTAAPNAKYLTVDGVDPLLTDSGNHTGTIPLPNSNALADVTLNHVQTGDYPIWSLLRFVSVGTAAPAGVSTLATATQDFVSFNTTTARPDFITANNMTVVRSHFVPPVPAAEPQTPANGHVGSIASSFCTAPEVGGDVGGVVITLANDSAFCSPVPPNGHNNPNGQTGQRR